MLALPFIILTLRLLGTLLMMSDQSVQMQINNINILLQLLCLLQILPSFSNCVPALQEIFHSVTALQNLSHSVKPIFGQSLFVTSLHLLHYCVAPIKGLSFFISSLQALSHFIPSLTIPLFPPLAPLTTGHFQLYYIKTYLVTIFYFSAGLAPLGLIMAELVPLFKTLQGLFYFVISN